MLHIDMPLVQPNQALSLGAVNSVLDGQADDAAYREVNSAQALDLRKGVTFILMVSQPTDWMERSLSHRPFGR